MSGEPLTFTRGSSSQSVTITIRDDITVEDSENFVARLSVNATLYPGVRLVPNTANVNIRDNDGKSTLHMFVDFHTSMCVQCCTTTPPNSSNVPAVCPIKL